MMSERQGRFRAEYVSKISPLYSGLLHIAVLYGVGAASAYFCLTRVQQATWEWLLAVPVFLTLMGQYLIYETFHFCCHVPENRFVRHMPLVNTIRRHHVAHHNMGIMMRVRGIA
jgi:hypothetical protein